jgi:Sulfotransferase domain
MEVPLTARLVALPTGRAGTLTPISRGLRDAERRATSRWRRLPDFLIAGAQKSGTTSLYDYICRHPDVDTAAAKGIHYFEEHYRRGLRWYRSRFPIRGAARLSGEATPAYLFYPVVPERVARDLPTARIIVVLRNPVERAYSHYQHERAIGVENLPLDAALSAEDERLQGEVERIRADADYVSLPLLHYSYRSRGLYAEQLQRWLMLVPKDRLLVLQAEQLFADPASVMEKTLSFLRLRPHRVERYPVKNARRYESMDSKVRTDLSRFYREPNDRLYELLGSRFAWD